MRNKLFLILFIFSLQTNIQAQPGCTDPLASNYDSDAAENDGSCLYPFTESSLETLAVLEDELKENSGLAFFNGNLWTVNDRGGQDKIYKIDSISGVVNKEVIIATADNEDWEDLAESPTHVFIGDFGNNNGDRMDLRIYKIEKADLEATTVVNAEVINFSYADQTDFEPNNNDHDFDCEAFFYLNGNLHLFTKNWDNFKTRHYIIPETPGTYIAEVEETFNAQCLVTGADINEDGTVALISYTNTGLNVMWLFYDYPDENFFDGNKRRINLGNALLNGQTEGIVFEDNGRGFIGSEEFQSIPPRIYSFETNQWVMPNSSNIQNLPNSVDFQIFPNPSNSSITIDALDIINVLELVDSNGKICYSEKIISNYHSFETQNLPSGVYVLKAYSRNGIGIKKVIIQ